VSNEATFSRWYSLNLPGIPEGSGGVPKGTDGVPDVMELAKELLLAGESLPRAP